MEHPFEQFRGSEFNGVKELADTTERILRSLGSSQGKSTVSEFPNERTIRYYLTEGLLPQPSEKRGLSLVFGYEHLLTLLVVKKLQADGLPISVIRTLIAGKSESELEDLFSEEVHVFTDARELENYRASIGHTDDSQVAVINNADAVDEDTAAPPLKNEAKSYLESLLFRKRDRPRQDASPPLFSRMAAPMSPPPEPPTAPPESWKRYTVAPGVEIHIERNFKPPRDESERRGILDSIERILHIRSRK